MKKKLLLLGIVAALLSPGCRHCCGKRTPLQERIFGGRDNSLPPGAILGPPAPTGSINIPPPTGGVPSTPAPSGGGFPGPSLPDSSRYRPEKEILYPDPLPQGSGTPGSGASKSSSPPINDPLLEPPPGSVRSRLESPAPLDKPKPPSNSAPTTRNIGANAYTASLPDRPAR